MATKMILAVVVLAGVMGGTVAQVLLCNLSQGDLQLCMPAISNQGGVNPSPECCNALAKADIPCFCTLRRSFLAPTLGINGDLATTLPAKCGRPPLVCPP